MPSLLEKLGLPANNKYASRYTRIEGRTLFNSTRYTRVANSSENSDRGLLVYKTPDSGYVIEVYRVTPRGMHMLQVHCKMDTDGEFLFGIMDAAEYGWRDIDKADMENIIEDIVKDDDFVWDKVYNE